MWNYAVESLVNLLFPKICCGCGNDVFAKDGLLCLTCINRIPLTSFDRLPSNPVERIFWGRLPLASAMSYAYFTKNSLVQHLLHELKYRSNMDIGIYFGRRIGESLMQSERFHNVQGLIPLPLNEKKEKQRGYNQATVICKGIYEATAIPILDRVVARPLLTKTQTHKGRIERWKTSEGKFQLLDSKSVEGKHVLLVDDVITTGATLEACGKHVLLVDDVITTGATLEACGQEFVKVPGLLLSVATLAYTAS